MCIMKLTLYIIVGLVIVCASTLCFYFGIRIIKGDYKSWVNAKCNLSIIVEDDLGCNFTLSLKDRTKEFHSRECPKDADCYYKKGNLSNTLTWGVYDDDSAWDDFAGIVLCLMGVLLLCGVCGIAAFKLKWKYFQHKHRECQHGDSQVENGFYQ